MVDIQTLSADIVPYAVSAISVYGAAILTRLETDAADSSVNLGYRIVQRILGRRGGDGEIESAVTDLAEDPNDTDLQAVLRVRIKSALLADSDLVKDIQAMLSQTHVSINASGEKSIAAQTITGIANTGDSATIQR
ncbi:hypothetical protein [Streptomyces griseocarneus]|uniref:hypothetical protein n=1 Tax=Streptomyces griseocarneus TaxID=51201 RepID=UPI00167D3291|nr:hypothetical protein [Streptomyces griseocarneus]MBZ6474370.1 hypothetical protein [Streptomyces griseocarneus]